MDKKISRTIFLLGIMGFLANGDIYSAAPVIVSISKDLNISAGDSALSITSYMLAFGLFTILFGPLGDRYGKAKVLIISSFCTAVFSCLSVFVYDLNSLIFLRFMNGAFAAGIMPVSMALLGDLVEVAKRQQAVAKLMGMMTLGGATAALIGGALSFIGSWKTVYLTYGIAELAAAFLIFIYVDRREDTVSRQGFLKVYFEMLKNKRLLSYLFVITLTGFCIFGSYPFAGELIREQLSMNILSIGIVLSAFGIGGLLGSRTAAGLRTIAGSRISIIAGLIGCISFAAVSLSNNVPLSALSLCLLGVAFLLLHSTMITSAQAAAPHMKGSVMSFVSFCMFIGSSAGTLVNKEILAELGVNSIFSASSVLFLALGIAAFLVLRGSPGKMH